MDAHQAHSSLTADGTAIDHYLPKGIPIGTCSGTAVLVPGFGHEKDYKDLDVAGKIAVVVRGGIERFPFGEKIRHAINAGAVGVVIFENMGGHDDMLDPTVHMWIAARFPADFEQLVPTVFVSHADGLGIAGKQVRIAVRCAGQVNKITVEHLITDIQQISRDTPNGAAIRIGTAESPLIMVDHCAFGLALYPNGETPEENGYVGLSLETLYCQSADDMVCEFSVKVKLPSDGRVVFSKFAGKDDYGFVRMFQISELPQDTDDLLICLTVHLYKPSARMSNSQMSSLEKSGLALAAMKNQSQFCDVQFVAGGIELQSFSCLVSSRSSVFEAMLSGEMVESGTRLINICDFSSQSVGDMLEFMHTSQTSFCVSRKSNLCRTTELLRLAQKYIVTDLVDYIVCNLSKSLPNCGAEFCCQVLLLAQESGVTKLRQRAMVQLTKSIDTVLQAQESIHFDELGLDLIAEILNRVSNVRKLKRKRKEEKEFPDGCDWNRLSLAQLRRACVEREMPDEGDRASLLSTLASS